jgi:putative transposase
VPWSEQIPIEKRMTREELKSRIKTLEKGAKILKRLYFVKFRYPGESGEESAQRFGVMRNEGYIWNGRWNERDTMN